MLETQNIYIPKGAQSLDKITTRPQIRLGLQGYAGTGKTWSALTFPNPIVLNLDRGLGSHMGRADVLEVPFYDPSFSNLNTLKENMIAWIEKDGSKLTVEQTLIVDGNTSIQNAYHRWWKANQYNYMTKSGQVDDFAQWRLKKDYFAEILENLKYLKCNVIYIMHETAQKDKEGGYSGKIRPLLTGQFGDEIINHFTDCFRQHAMEKPKSPTLQSWGCKTQEEFDSMWQGAIKDNTIFYWQTMSDNVFDAKASSLVNFPSLIPATYNHIKKYMR